MLLLLSRAHVWEGWERMDVEKELEETIKEIEESVFSIPLSPRERLLRLSRAVVKMRDKLSSIELKLLNENKTAVLAVATSDLCRLLERVVDLMPELIRPFVYEAEED
jgi:Mg2+ and Co2+ transporter CorA